MDTTRASSVSEITTRRQNRLFLADSVNETGRLPQYGPGKPNITYARIAQTHRATMQTQSVNKPPSGPTRRGRRRLSAQPTAAFTARKARRKVIRVINKRHKEEAAAAAAKAAEAKKKKPAREPVAA